MIPFIDGHNDTLLDLHLAGAGAEAFVAGRPGGHLDLPRARSCGFAGGLFAIFVMPESEEERQATRIPNRPPPYSQPLASRIPQPYAYREALAMVALLEEIEVTSEGEVRVVRELADVTRAIEGGPLAAVLHFEGADPIDAELETLEPLYARGLRSVGLVWSRPNAFAEGVAFRFPSTPDTGPGLTPAGRRLVGECNRLGIVLDLAHLNERGFWDAAELSQAPLVASHSNAHALSPNSRNLMDTQLDEIGRADGIVGITFHAGMLGAEGGIDLGLPLARVIDHVDYVVGRIGIDHVGFGSDFDGAKLPTEIGDVEALPRVVDALRARGYGDVEIAKLAHANWLRVLRQTWQS